MVVAEEILIFLSLSSYFFSIFTCEQDAGDQPGGWDARSFGDQPRKRDFGYCSEVGVVWTPPEGFLLVLYLDSETHLCQQRNWGLPGLPRVSSSRSLLAHRPQNWCPVQWENLCSKSTGKRGVRKHVCDTGTHRQCPGSHPWATRAKGRMSLLRVSVPKWLAAWTWLVAHQVFVLHWSKLKIPWLSHQLTSRWHLAAPCCIKMLACHLALSELEEEVLSLRDVICLIYLAPALLLLGFFTLGACNEFSELKSDFQGWLFAASRKEKKSSRVSCLLLENTFHHP